MTPRRRFLKSSAALAGGMFLPCDSGAGYQSAAPGGPMPPPVDSGAPPTAALPKVKLGSYEVSRLIIGANPFYGFSHFNNLFSRHMSEWSTPENIVRTLAICERNGINTWQFSHSGRGLTDIEHHRAAGGKMNWLLLSSRKLEEDLSLIPQIAKQKPIGIVHHGGATDRRWRNGEQARIKEFLKAVRDSGVMVGLSTHTPEIVETVEEQNWDVDFFMTCIYRVTRTDAELEKLLGQKPLGEIFLPNDPPRMFQAIRQSRKTCLAYKILAAGRVTDSPKQIDQAFQTAFDNIKPRDCVIVGMLPRYTDQVRENADRVRRICGIT
jgi:hypothetical protein